MYCCVLLSVCSVTVTQFVMMTCVLSFKLTDQQFTDF